MCTEGEPGQGADDEGATEVGDEHHAARAKLVTEPAAEKCGSAHRDAIGGEHKAEIGCTAAMCQHVPRQCDAVKRVADERDKLTEQEQAVLAVAQWSKRAPVTRRMGCESGSFRLDLGRC